MSWSEKRAEHKEEIKNFFLPFYKKNISKFKSNSEIKKTKNLEETKNLDKNSVAEEEKNLKKLFENWIKKLEDRVNRDFIIIKTENSIRIINDY